MIVKIQKIDKIIVKADAKIVCLVASVFFIFRIFHETGKRINVVSNCINFGYNNDIENFRVAKHTFVLQTAIQKGEKHDSQN